MFVKLLMTPQSETETTAATTANTTQNDSAMSDNMNSVQLVAKRIIDIIGAVCGMILSSPLMLVIVLCLKIKNEGSIIFRQERIGLGGKPFYIYKFRTFHVEAESDKPHLATDKADRLTSYGKFLRERHLDELPQLWNVLKGDMSIVGPRPERKYFIDRIMQQDNRYSYIYLMRPGLTSEATVKNGYTDTMEKMLRRLDMDLRYLTTRTIAGDFRIMFLTTRKLLSSAKF